MRGLLWRARFLAAGMVFVAATVSAQTVGASRDPVVRRTLYQAALEREALTGSDARLLGLGGAGVAISTGPESLLWSPASLTDSENVRIAVADEPVRSRGVSREGSVALSGNLRALGSDRWGALGVAHWAQGWGIDPVRNRTLAVGYASARERGLAFGVALRRETRTTAETDFGGWGIDGGVSYAYEFSDQRRVGLGASVTNFGTRLSSNSGEGLALAYSPPIVRAGIAYQPDADTLLASQWSYAHDDLREVPDRHRFHLGLERWFAESRAAARVGYNATVRRDRFGKGVWSFGASYRVLSGRLDYALVTGKDALGRQLRARHLITMSLDWASPVLSLRRTSAPIAQVPVEDPQPVQLPDGIDRLVTVERDVFSPSRDGGGEARFHIASLPSAWTLEIMDRDRRTVRSHAGEAKAPITTLGWNGRDRDDLVVPDGVYYWRLMGSGGTNRVLSQGAVTVDASAPVIAIASEPLAFLHDKQSSDARLSLAATDAGIITAWSVRIQDAGGKVLVATAGKGVPPRSIAWRNWQESVDAGSSCVAELTATDEAGNASAVRLTMPVLDLRHTSAAVENGSLAVSMPATAFAQNGIGLTSQGSRLVAQLGEAWRAHPNLDLVIQQSADPVTRAVTTSHVATLQSALQSTASADRSPVRVMDAPTADSAAVKIVLSGRLRASFEPSVARATPTPRIPAPEGSPASAAEQTPAASVAAPTPGAVAVLVGSFREKPRADQLVAQINAMNLGSPARIEVVSLSGENWYRVLIGNFSSRDSAGPVHAAVRQRVNADAILFVSDPR
ncbi:hypothetical protein FJZ36_01285 [Candidatus Poribacteria bacterium]|nr:hypothetical protein [Candidatus Poribacteria bacterium]